jgi:hypothetical protein
MHQETTPVMGPGLAPAMASPVVPDREDPPIEVWPVLQVGDTVEIDGAPFEVARLNESTVVLRPISKQRTARQIVDDMQRRGA